MRIQKIKPIPNGSYQDQLNEIIRLYKAGDFSKFSQDELSVNMNRYRYCIDFDEKY